MYARSAHPITIDARPFLDQICDRLGAVQHDEIRGHELEVQNVRVLVRKNIQLSRSLRKGRTDTYRIFGP